MILSMRLLILILITCWSVTSAQISIPLKEIASGIMAPVAMDSPKDGTNRLFICEQTGKVKIIQPGSKAQLVFLDITPKLDKPGKGYSEKGLLGIAFHPKYKTNGKFYIYYSAPASSDKFDHTDVVEEYKVGSNPNSAQLNSGRIILKVDHPESNHNGGQLAFGPDGFLYIGIGDGGGGGDEHGRIGNGQSLNTLLGKILRIDVNSGNPYSIPPDNPFVKTRDAKPEIWAYGLRNPWRFSFDRKTGKLFCGDVGQNKYEEVDIIEKGGNYGWRLKEGNHCYNPSTGCDVKGLKAPIAEYGRDKGISITGGYVYNGSEKQLQGKYIFGDWKGNMYFLDEKNNWKMNDLVISGKKDNDLRMNINSFGEDEKGELYILAQKFTGAMIANGVIYKVEK